MRHISYRPLFICILLCVGFFRAAGQDFKFSHLGVEQGLSQSVVNCILQDNKGFLWFGTQEGLNRYDGYKFKVFKRDPQNTNSLGGNFIYTLYEDKKGQIWIGTNGAGLDVYNPINNSFTHYVNDPKNTASLSDNAVRVIYEDAKGRMWIGTDNGLNLLDTTTKKFTRFLHNDNDRFSIGGNHIFSIAEDKYAKLWIATYESGLNVYDEATRQFTNYQPTLLDAQRIYPRDFTTVAEKVEQMRQVRTIKMNAAGLFLLGTDGAGLQVFDPLNHVFTEAYIEGDRKPATINDNRIFTLELDEAGNVWAGTYRGGLNVLSKDKKWSQYYLSNDKDMYAISNNSLRCIYSDRQGNIWIGSNGSGVDVYFKQTALITHLRKSERPEVGENTLKSNFVFSILEDHTGLLWIGTLGGGLTSFDQTTNTYTHRPKLSTANNNGVLSLLEDRKGNIWVGTYGEGINVWNRADGSIKKILPNTTRGDGTILCMTEEPKTGAIWFGTYNGGIFRVDPNTFELTHFNSENGLSTDIIFSLFFDTDGNLWIGGKGGGLMKRDMKTGTIKVFKNDPDKPSISNNVINAISQDKKGNLWICTINGLNRFNPQTETFTVYYEKEGIASDYVYGAIEDQTGKIWVSNNKGISCFLPYDPDGAHFINYGTAEGVQSGEFNQGAWFKGANNMIYFGGQNGLNRIDANAPLRPQSDYLVRLLSFQRFGKEIALDSAFIYKKYILLDWKENNFQFEFASNNYISPEKNRYQYYLEGFDDGWSSSTENNLASYTNVPGGHYTFHVRTFGLDGLPLATETILHITITPPFWRTYWFYTLCILFTIAFIFVFIRLRTRAVRKENEILEAKVTERTQELAQKNQDITSSIEYARRIQHAMLPETEYIFSHLYDAFILYKPKDIVSGDFYWFAEKNGRKIIAVADCTGHGVPGALMSMIGHNLLNQIVQEKNITSPEIILQLLNDGVRAALKQDQHLDIDTADGMDMAICSIDIISGEVLFSGALRPLALVSNGTITKIECDRFSIGGSKDERERKYTSHKIQMKRGDRIYLFTDGFADQFGGPEGKKFMVKRLFDVLLELPDFSMHEQGNVLDKIFEEWRGQHDQIDDVLIVGIRL